MRSHGCVGRTIKRVVLVLVKSSKITRNTVEEFAMKASKAVPSIQSIYLSRHDKIIKPLFVKVASYIQRTLDNHYVKRLFNSKRVCFLQLCRSLNNFETFHVQYYSAANTLVCNDRSSESNKNECGFCKEPYDEDEMWQHCPSCKIWFHEECFEK